MSSHSKDELQTAGESNCYEFESTVCYAFITRFPLFEFFFQVIFDLITVERLSFMELSRARTPTYDQGKIVRTNYGC